MGNLRKLKRSIAKSPERVFMAKIEDEKRKSGKDPKLSPEQRVEAGVLSKEIEAINKGD